MLHICSMNTDQEYKAWSAYFKEIATKSVYIQHIDSNDNSLNNKRFFSSDLQSFIIDQQHNLPKYTEDRCFLHFIAPQFRLHEDKATYEVMFFVLFAAPIKDIQKEEIGRSLTSSCVNSIIAKMIADSKMKLPLFNRALDRGNNILVSPYSFKGQNSYVGYQVSFKITAQFFNCVQTSDWL